MSRPEAGAAGNALAYLLQAGAFMVARERWAPTANNQKHFCGGWMPRNPRSIVDAQSHVSVGPFLNVLCMSFR